MTDKTFDKQEVVASLSEWMDNFTKRENYESGSRVDTHNCGAGAFAMVAANGENLGLSEAELNPLYLEISRRYTERLKFQETLADFQGENKWELFNSNQRCIGNIRAFMHTTVMHSKVNISNSVHKLYAKKLAQ